MENCLNKLEIFNNRDLYDLNNPQDIVDRLGKDFNEGQYRKVLNSKSSPDLKLEMLEYQDIDKVKQKNKLLELIIVMILLHSYKDQRTDYWLTRIESSK